jgi:hypothetical protein
VIGFIANACVSAVHDRYHMKSDSGAMAAARG